MVIAIIILCFVSMVGSGREMGNLTVLTLDPSGNAKILWTKSTPSVSEWSRALVTLPMGLYRPVIQGTVTGSKGDIAVDDIIINTCSSLRT